MLTIYVVLFICLCRFNAWIPCLYLHVVVHIFRYGPGLVVYWHGCLKELATYFAYAGSGSGSINSIISFGTNTSTSMNGMSSNNISNSSSGDATTTNSGVAGAASQDIHEEIARILSAADCASIRFTDGYVRMPY
jgi:hypothetical protein